MTDDQIGEIVAGGATLLLGSQQSFQIQAYPFRMYQSAHGLLEDAQGRQRSFRGDDSNPKVEV